MKIAVARLRSQIRFEQPMFHIMDSFYVLLRNYVQQHREHDWSYYGFSWGGPAPYDDAALRRADVVVIPSEAEFTYHVPGLLHSLDVKRSNERVRALAPLIAGKRIVVLRFDRRDNEELFREYTWPNVVGDFSYREIDENDFPPSVNALKYGFVREARNGFDGVDAWPNGKRYDVAYWGTDKRKSVAHPGERPLDSGDERHLFLRTLDRTADITPLWIGLMRSVRERHVKFSPMLKLMPLLQQARATICTNWYDSTAITARYFEAVGMGMIPLVWKDYDATGKLAIQPWQRVQSTDDLLTTLRWLRAHEHQRDLYDSVEHALTSRIFPTATYVDTFEALMRESLT